VDGSAFLLPHRNWILGGGGLLLGEHLL
jgi:hypothetical protein